MKTIAPALIGWMLAASILLCPAETILLGQDSGGTASVKDELAGMLEKFREEHDAPGVSACVWKDGKYLFNQGSGFSDLENKVQATENTVYRTASIAKSITAVAVLQLVDQGKIKLDDPIQKHCPEFPEQESTMTVRHLLCHQSGVRHYQAAGEAAGKAPYFTLRHSVEIFKNDPLKFKSGTAFGYTTYGYTLLGRAVETASGKSFRDYLGEYVFQPAEMEASGFDDWFRIIPHRTRGYSKLSRRMIATLPESLRGKLNAGEVYNCELHDTSMKVPGGGLVSTAGDLVRFGIAMLDNRLITETTRDQAWTRQKLADGSDTNYGLGWQIRNLDGDQLISHSGGQAGTATFLVIDPGHRTIVAVMCNLQGAPSSALARQILKAVR